MPGGYNGKIYRQIFYLYKDSTFYIDVAYGYDDNDTLPFELSVNYSAVPATKVEGNRVQWVYTTPQKAGMSLFLTPWNMTAFSLIPIPWMLSLKIRNGYFIRTDNAAKIKHFLRFT